MKKFLSLAFLCLAIASCSKYATNGDNLYLQSRNGETIVVPKPLTRANISDANDLPEQKQSATVSVEPPQDAINV